jgi:hypothetical protein
MAATKATVVTKPTPPPSLVIREGSTKVTYIKAVTATKK